MRADQVVAASAGRDRVLDAVKTGALVVVMVAHSLAWHTVHGEPGNVLELKPGLAVITWGLQILALFFAAGAVSNAASLARCGDPQQWLGNRLRRLLGPVLVYASVWSAVLLPLAPALGHPVAFAGRFLAQLLWFAGVYLVVVAVVPWTVRHQGLPVLLGWLALIAAVDAVRLTVLPALGWVNLLLVWGWLHQVGYRLPQLRDAPRLRLLAGAVAALAAALALAWLGPYSDSMVSVAGDPEPSNLAPPTLVVALHGLALILLLAALWRPLDRALRAPALWVPIAVLGARGIGLYLWHIPVVGVIAAACWGWSINPEPLSLAWWLLHLATVVAVVAGAWLLAGVAAGALPSLERIAGRTAARHVALTLGAAGVLTLLLSVTGFGTWWATAFLGVPSATPVLLALLWLLWRLRPAVSPARPAAASRPVPAG